MNIILAWLRLIYHQIVYWLAGTTPEAHHANLASIWYELGNHRNCIEHCEKYLTYEESDYVKAMLGYSQGALSNWKKAAVAYRSISGLWSEPSFALGLAEAEFRCGNIDKAREIVATVSVSHPNPRYDVAMSLEHLTNELETSTDSG